MTNSGLDTTLIRLSEHFLLSDFMGCHSVYVNGWKNIFSEEDDRVEEGATLCERVLELALGQGPISIAYGFISPEVSRKLVKHQDPDKPSYHKWDDGAAADITLHLPTSVGIPPIHTACRLDTELPLSRTITYSESPYICLATRRHEIDLGTPRKALYENRYMGEVKPKFLRYSENPETRIKQKANIDLAHDWRGVGYPRYHCGGGQKLEHIRVGTYHMMIDFLFSPDGIRQGLVNNPNEKMRRKFSIAAFALEELSKVLNVRRFSITRGYESWSDTPHNWKRNVVLEIVPPKGVHTEKVLEVCRETDFIHSARRLKNRKILVEVDNATIEKIPSAVFEKAVQKPGVHGGRTRRIRRG